MSAVLGPGARFESAPAGMKVEAKDGSKAVPAEAPPAATVAAPAKAVVSPKILQAQRRALFLKFLAPAAGFALFVLVWQIIAQSGGQIPTPAKVWEAAVKIFSDPFYRKGPNDQGIGWNILASLQRVGVGFGLAALVGIPLGFMIGRFAFLRNMAEPVIGLLRPVSPLAWLPIGLLVFQGAHPAAVWTIFISSIWPMIINTAVGVQRVPQDYLNVARVLSLSEWKEIGRAHV